MSLSFYVLHFSLCSSALADDVATSPLSYLMCYVFNIYFGCYHPELCFSEDFYLSER